MQNILFFYWFFVSFFFGAIMGSFLNVLIYEIEGVIFEKQDKINWKNLMTRRSHCLKCRHNLNFLDLVPIFSFIFLKAKCRYCHTHISWRYFLIEILSGSFFIFIFYYLWQQFHLINFNFIIAFIFWTTVLSFLIITFVLDAKHKIIINLTLWHLLFLGAIFNIFDFKHFNFINIDYWYWIWIFWKSIVFSFPFFAIAFLSKERAMGLADWKLIFVLSLFFNSWLQNLLFIFSAFWIGTLYSLPILLLKKKIKLKSEIPFGPFIIIAFLLIFSFDISYNVFLSKISYV